MKTDKYLNADFEQGGSLAYANGNPIWVQFVRDFRSDLKGMLKGSEWTLYKLSNGHYELYGFLYNEHLDKWMYFSISDVRFFQDEWANSVLIRTAKNDKDYTGGMNCYTKFKNIPQFLQREFIYS